MGNPDRVSKNVPLSLSPSFHWGLFTEISDGDRIIRYNHFLNLMTLPVRDEIACKYDYSTPI